MREGWEYKKLNEVCDKGSSNIVINKLIDNNGDYPLYGASGLIKDIDFYHQDKRYIGIVKDGAGVGRVNIYPAFSSLVGTMQYIFPKEGYSLDFIKYFLIKLDLSHCVSGATIPHIYFKDYGKELIPTPSLDAQLEIVSELDKINELIRLKKEQLKDFDNLAQSLFYEMFGDPVENEKGWEVKKLGELLKVIGGYAFKSDKYKDEGIPILRIGNINSGFFRDTNLVFAESDEKLEKYKIFPGDIVISLTGTVGKSDYGNVCIMDDAYNFYYLNQRNAKLEIFGNLDKYYLSAILKNEDIKSRLTSISRGVRQANIANKDIENLQIPLPPLPLQQLFAHRIEQIEQQKAEVQKAITDLETLLASRMQYWFE